MGSHPQASSYTAAAPRGFFNLIWGIVATILSVLWTAICAISAASAALINKPHWVTLVTRAWGRGIIGVSGIKVQIEGLENLTGLRSYVLVANHQSFFDIFATAAYMPGEPRFVGKKELLKVPLVGFAMKHGGHILIDREAGGQAIRKAIKIIQSGLDVCVFAEGHRFNDNRIHEFEDGAAWLAILSKLPVVPMSISGSGVFFPRGAMFVTPGLTMKMRIGKPISTDGMRSADRTELTHRLEEAVRASFTTEV
ncbi:lysophospholipid acyltransferase family protein [Candidatus Binatus sp.]|jgi:1-acyl-sn-glycerol-3-phosphate acyltransferase|uniref:lysophospholipid acyltransferase family protein n=1 Tax=Candidatus Binatus sp. TaxID=2811406 RepID=UPI003CA0F700